MPAQNSGNGKAFEGGAKPFPDSERSQVGTVNSSASIAWSQGDLAVIRLGNRSGGRFGSRNGIVVGFYSEVGYPSVSVPNRIQRSTTAHDLGDKPLGFGEI